MPALAARLILERRYAQTWLWTVLLVNPLVTVAITAFTGPHRSLKWAFLFGYLFANIVATTSMLAGALSGVAIAAVRRRFGTDPNRASTWRLAAAFALFGLPLGHWLALHAIVWVGRALGFQMPDASWEGSGPYLLLGAGIFGAFFLWRERVNAVEALERSENARLHAQLSALTAQLNPHLLFNALNTIASLIETDPGRAEHTVLRLAELYRAVLAASQRAQHSLSEELALCRAYLDVEQARFGDRLSVEIRLEPAVRADQVQLPVLMLHPLVENAVKHGLSDKATGGHLRIAAARQGERLILSVEDDGVGMGNSTRAGTGTGLATCRRRLALGYADAASLELAAAPGGGTRAVLTLPLPAASEVAA